MMRRLSLADTINLSPSTRPNPDNVKRYSPRSGTWRTSHRSSRDSTAPARGMHSVKSAPVLPARAMSFASLHAVSVNRMLVSAAQASLPALHGAPSSLLSSVSDSAEIADQLRRSLSAPDSLARVIDLFRSWDHDGSGSISVAEFARALPVLGHHVPRHIAAELFGQMDRECARFCTHSLLASAFTLPARYSIDTYPTPAS